MPVFGRLNGQVAKRNRQAQRIKTASPGRLTLAGHGEIPCRILDLSDIGALVQSRVRGLIGETAVIYLESEGRIAGRIVRVTNSGFAIEFPREPVARVPTA